MAKKTTTNRYADAPYAVGKGKPPQHTQFKAGQSGNRKGRPKKASLNVQVKEGMLKGLEELVTVRTSSGAIQVPAFVAIFLKVRNKVIESGSPRQLRDLLAIVREFGVLTPEELQQRLGGVLVVPPRSASADEWERDYGKPLQEAQQRLAAQIAARVGARASQGAGQVDQHIEAPRRITMPKAPELPIPRPPEPPRTIPESERQLALIREETAKMRERDLATQRNRPG